MTTIFMTIERAIPEPRRSCYAARIQERAVLSNAHPEKELARLTRERARFDSRTIAPHD
jgi:hypothetical protein